MAAALIGRRALIDLASREVARGTSLLLVGPAGVGKTALAAAITRGASVEIVDPFERVSRARAVRLRQHLDRGVTVVGATTSLERRVLGAVGRILWRFQIVRVPPLPPGAMRRLILRDLDGHGIRGAVEASWLRDLVRVSAGLPGRGHTLAAAAAEYWRQAGQWPTPAWALVEALTAGWDASARCPRGSGTGGTR
jgi:hypothetical protein